MLIRNSVVGLAALAATGLLPTSAEAVPLLQIVGGTAGTIPSGATNEVVNALWGVTEVPGYYGATLLLTEDSGVSFEFLGFEAGYENTFNLDIDGNGSYEEIVFSTEDFSGNSANGDPLDGPELYSLSVGNVPFAFVYNANSGTVANDGSNPDDSGGSVGPNYFLTFFGPNATYGTFGTANACALSAVCNPRSGQIAYAFLDDGGAGPDDNHDDGVVEISVVPEPATLGLLGSGLLALGLMMRRRRDLQE